MCVELVFVDSGRRRCAFCTQDLLGQSLDSSRWLCHRGQKKSLDFLLTKNPRIDRFVHVFFHDFWCSLNNLGVSNWVKCRQVATESSNGQRSTPAVRAPNSHVGEKRWAIWIDVEWKSTRYPKNKSESQLSRVIWSTSKCGVPKKTMVNWETIPTRNRAPAGPDLGSSARGSWLFHLYLVMKGPKSGKMRVRCLLCGGKYQRIHENPVCLS